MSERKTWVPKKTILDTPVEQLSDGPTQTPISPEAEEVKSLIAAASSTPLPAEELTPLTIEQAAERLGVSRQTLRNWEASGKLVPERTLGGHRRYSESQINVLQKRQLAAQETILPGITPTWLAETGKTLLAGFAPDEKINLILSQGAMDGVFRITIESEDGLKQVVRRFQPKG